MIYAFDLDGTLVTSVKNSEYEKAQPLHGRIAKVNQMYDEGHTIVFYTARGLSSGRGEQHYRPITEQQLKEWGCKYHELTFKSHDADVFIDDKAVNIEEFFEKS